MMARFLHFYPGYTAEKALTMPWRRFLALVRAIPAVVAEQRLQLLETVAVAANPGERGEQYSALVDRLSGSLGQQPAQSQPRGIAVVPGFTPAAFYEAEPGSIAAEMARQRAAWEEMQKRRTEASGL